MLALQAAQGERLAPAHLARAQGDAGRAAHGVQQVGGIALGQVLGGDDGDAGRRGARVLLGQRGRDGDGGQRRGGHDFGARGAGQAQQRGSGGHGQGMRAAKPAQGKGV
ncbi:arginine/serine-rich splicing factor [Alicycliphilus sp. B1]|nr:arginine/serine-rich splicing factor [Alicycliphilus sp. B1]